MKKTIFMGSVFLATSLFFVSCSATKGVDVKKEDYVHLKKSMPLKKINQKIMKAGEEDGWRMTPFKENAIIAEKTEGEGETQAVTVTFGQDYFTLDPDNDDLEDAIAESFGL